MLIEEDLEATKAKLAELHSVHRSLDKMISHLADSPVQDELELRRLKLALEQTVLTPDARAEGFGDVNAGRLALMASQVSDAFATKERVNANAVWNAAYLPSVSERAIFGK